jgi:RHS repeat-associated protein
MPAINEKTDVTNTYVWNAESEIKTGAGVNYTYDGDGDRVQKSSGKIYWYGAGTEVLDESDSAGNISDEYVFLGGRRVAHRVVSGNSIYYYGEDFLGTSRLIATAAGSVCYEADFYPFGGERDITSTCTPTYKFEGKERDTETNNDDFGARYYSSQFGRWTSPDWSSMPAPVPYANLTNPQTLNLYAMVSDNPESFADLDGHEDDGGAGDAGAGSGTQQQQSSSTPQNQGGQTTQQQNSGTPQSQTPSMNSTPKTPQQQNAPTIGPNPNWFDGRQADCIGQGLKAGAEDLLPLHDEIKAVSDSIADGSAKPLKELISIGTATEAAKEGSKKVVESRGAQKAVKSLIKSAGGRVSANAVGRAASLTVKASAVINLGVALTTAFNGYQSCMAY